MSTIKFKCTLLSDIILNQKAATEGPNTTLDFIPGSNFLGIAASTLYNKLPNEQAWEIFHSGNVHFGDAHPSLANSSFRGLKTPAAMYYPKLSTPNQEVYIHHYTNHTDDIVKKKQLKQCRNGFYDFSTEEAVLVKTDTNFAIKSAYDKDKRRSKDEQMYGYESLEKDLVLYFEVEVRNDLLAEKIKESLVGIKRIGRSRTAQYGLVKIEEHDYKEVKSRQSDNNLVEVYADSRLIFLDPNGIPIFRPTAEQLGLDGEICWEQSQIRTFQYAPWNFKRQCFDTDRCGIEKGSVFIVKSPLSPQKSQYVGSYNNEGFGKVIYNPIFLKAAADGKSVYRLTDKPDNTKDANKKNTSLSIINSPLLKYLTDKKKQEAIEMDAYSCVNEWVSKNQFLFKGQTFASQWGAIRSIAMRHKTKSALLAELFDKEITMRDGKTRRDGYLTHGVAKEKWDERGRGLKLRKFIEELNDDNVQITVINLAAEMAKKCKED